MIFRFMNPRRILLSAGCCSTLLVLAAVFVVPGCGKGSGDAEVAAEGDEAAEEPDATERPSQKPAKPSKKKSKSGDAAHIGEIPKDLWPELWLKDPLAVAAEGAAPAPRTAVKPEPTAVARVDTPAPMPETAKPAAQPPASAAGGSNEWLAMISGEELGNEVKAVKASLSDKLQSVGKFSGNYKEVRVEAAVLAALAGIAIEHPEGPTWKKNAKFVRDLSGEMVSAAKANGQKFYDPTKQAFEKMESVLSGSLPPDLGEAAESVPFNEVAERRQVMLRLQRVKDYLMVGVSTEAQFGKETEKVAHEAAVLRALVKVIGTAGYDASDEDQYKNFTGEIIEAGKAVGEAVKGKDFKNYRDAVNRIDKACQGCHAEYKNS